MPKITFKGTVYTGSGEGRKFIDLPWVKQQIQEKLDFTPFSGTLNIHLNKESAKQKALLEKSERLQIYPETGYCIGILIKAHVDDLACAIIIPQIPHYPIYVLELVAAWCLRERLNLHDGDEVTVTVNV